MLRSERCLYCGAPTGATALALPAAAEPRAAKLPVELVIALEPRQRAVSSRSLWLRRVLALGGAGVLIAFIMGPCMRV